MTVVADLYCFICLSKDFCRTRFVCDSSLSLHLKDMVSGSQKIEFYEITQKK